MLEVALISWAMQRVAAAGFMLHGTPDLVRATVLEKCGFQPRGNNTQVGSHSLRILQCVIGAFPFCLDSVKTWCSA